MRPPPTGFPAIPYLAVYRANLAPPESDLCVARTPDLEIKLSPGPIQFSYTTPVVRYAPPGASLAQAQRHCELPPGSYLLIRIRVEAADPASARRMAALRVAEATCVFDLRYPGLIAEKLYEGTVNEPGRFVFMGEGPLWVAAQPHRDPEDVAHEIATDFSSLRGLSEGDRDRFQLAARWFRRGQEAINLVDKLLFLWTVLEIYPAMGKRKVSNTTSRFLSERLYRDLSRQEIKEKTKLGRIEGVRDGIVHKGKAFVGPTEEEPFSGYIQRLEVIAATCLRMLAGMPPGDELDKYVRQN